MKNLTQKCFTLAALAVILFVFSGPAGAMEGHGHGTGGSERVGDLFHESMQNGYMLSYYLMDLRDTNEDKAADSHAGHDHAGHQKKEMDKPHHIMVYIMDKDHNPVEKAKVGFLIKGEDTETQKVMAMYMSGGFGITADMKAKGAYEISLKAVIGDVTLMDRFTHEMN
ncbi:MAG: hypothetical protein AB1Z81_15255 [Desulfotignum sp.]